MTPPTPSTRLLFASTLVGLFAAGALVAQPPDPPQPLPPPPPAPTAAPAPAGPAAGPQALARGPLHEAFGRPVVFDPKPGPVAPKAPPDPVEELPPDQKPEGENVRWIPGYWHWDDEAKDFIWVSGFWRAVPPGRAWVPGYWTPTPQGYQWVSGYWAADGQQESEYLPPPPGSLEAGPPTDPPGADHLWSPGTWVWQGDRYLWRPGTWIAANPDWVWVPAHYGWTPGGYVFTDGYWDYPLLRRGLPFAPVRFGGGLRPGLGFTPGSVLNLANLATALFARPRFGQYYFGDYFGPGYQQSGFLPWYALAGSRAGYDPLFAYTNWFAGRQDPLWATRLREGYDLRRTGDRDLALVRPLADVAQARDFPVRLERADAKAWEKQVKEYRKLADERGKWEAKQVGAAGPARVRLPDSPAFVPPGQAGRGNPVVVPGPPAGVRGPAVVPGGGRGPGPAGGNPGKGGGSPGKGGGNPGKGKGR